MDKLLTKKNIKTSEKTNLLLKLLITAIVLTLVVNITHEFCHWVTGLLFGIKAIFGFNNTTFMDTLKINWYQH